MANYNFIGADGKSYGPYSVEQMRRYMVENRVTTQSQVSANGGPWQPAANFQELTGGAHAPHPPQGSPAAHGRGHAPMNQGYQKPHRGSLILVLGILSFFCGWFAAIPAWVMANNDMKEMDQGIMDPSGRGSTRAGKICAIISIILGCICGLGYGAFVTLVISAAP